MQNKRVLIISCVFPPESVTSAATSLDLANNLANAGHKVSVLCPQPNRSVDERWDFKLHESVEVIRVYSIRAGNSYFKKVLENVSFGVFAFLFLNKRFTFDACYINSWPLFSTFLITNRLKKKKIKYIYSVQDLYPETLVIKGIIRRGGWLYKVFKKIERHICSESSMVVAISKSFKEYLVNEIGVERQRVKVIPNWSSEEVKLEDPTSSWAKLSEMGIRHDGFNLFLGFGGNISASTGILEFVKFYLRSTWTSKLIIAGSGSVVKKIKELARQDNRIDLLSPWPKDLSNSFYSICNILILPVPSGQEHGSVPSKLLNYINTDKPIFCICDSDCEITRMLESYEPSLITSWSDLENITYSKIEELSTGQYLKIQSANKDILNDDLSSLSELTQEVLNVQ